MMNLTEEELIVVYTELAERKGRTDDEVLRAILRTTRIPSYNNKFNDIQDLVMQGTDL